MVMVTVMVWVRVWVVVVITVVCSMRVLGVRVGLGAGKVGFRSRLGLGSGLG